MPRFAVVAWIPLACVLAACAADRKRSFEIRTMDTEGTPVPCVVLVEGAVHPDPENTGSPLVTNTPNKYVDLTFKPKPDGTYPVFEVQVRALRHDPDTRQLISGSWKTAPSPYLMTESGRRLRHNDPELHLFILRRNPEYR
ncbi:MAG: hypothetical protein JXQ29_18455 [Planctomycetes bacterium]|nr:hypothetical protein [Planctomycetota bacterium]